MSGTASAALTPVAPLAGPSAAIVDFGGVAMSEDGTGGAVWRQREADGTIHIYAAQFDERWLPAQRVDAGQRFDASWPAIGAGDGGRLVVTWAQEAGPERDRMLSSTLDPGARRFGPIVPVDLNIGEATDTWPALAMNRGGQALLVFRVTQNPARNPNLPPGTVEGEYRLARTSGQLWTGLGVPLNRNPAAPVRRPTADNAPKVVVDAAGNGVVAWQEPDDAFVDRVWARRVFGAGTGLVLAVSPQKQGTVPLRGGADQLAMDVAGFGQAVVAVRQQPEPGSGGRPRIMAATISESFAPDAAAFGAARVADGQGAAGPRVAPGPASVASAPGGLFATAVTVGADALLIRGDKAGIGSAERLNPASAPEATEPLIDLAPSGALAAAYRFRAAGRSQVGLVERQADGLADSAALAAPRGGTVADLRFAGSGLGDAIAGWRQGTGAATQIVAGVVDAPPEPFEIEVPVGFSRKRTPLTLRWDPAVNAVGGVTYAVTVDDDEVVDGLRRRRHDLRVSGLDDGVTSVGVIATDARGQETTSTAQVKLDRRGPGATVRVRGRRVTVRVSDGARGQASGADHEATRVRWGDGRTSSGKAGRATFAHASRRRGRVTVRVTATDRIGNRRTTTKRVRIR